MAAFRLAVKLGATGLESDVWLTNDGVAVLDHDGWVGPRWRRRPIADTISSALPEHIPTLAELAELAQVHQLALSLDIKDAAAYDVVGRTLADVSSDLVNRSFICCEDFELLQTIAPRLRNLQLIDSSRLATMKTGPERRLADLSNLGVVGLNMHHTDWNGGLVTLAHRFNRLALAWDAQFEYQLTTTLLMGIDGLYSDWVDRMVDAARVL
jgi:glycerophosphoryl diester phosphodiesterase